MNRERDMIGKGESLMTKIRYAQMEDKEFWYSLDKHLPEQEFENKVRDKMAYVLCKDNKPIGLLRYGLFWDNTPFCNLLFIDWAYHRKGYGRMLMEFWEKDMKSRGYGMLLTSTRWMKMHSTSIESLATKIAVVLLWMCRDTSNQWK